MVFDGNWRNVLLVRRVESNMLVCICRQVQDLVLCKACVLPLETSLTPMRVARDVVPSGAKWEDLGCSTRLSSQAAWASCRERAALKAGGSTAWKRVGSTSGAMEEWILWENFYGEIRQV